MSTAGTTGTQLSPGSRVASSGTNLIVTDTRSTLNILGFYAQETIGFKSKLFVTGAIRNDVASSFGQENRWQFYPKISGTYLISEEGFWKDSSIGSVVSIFKLRASYGQSGNLTAINAYDRLTNYTAALLAGLPGVAAPSQLGNATVKPERQIEKEIGLDASFFRDRFGFEFSYYDKSVEDLLLLVNLRPSTGYLSQYQNIGNMSNKGFELLVRGIPIQRPAFEWNASVIFSKNKNKVFESPGGLLTFPGGFGQVAAVEGYPLGAFYATAFARTPDGSLLLTPAGLPQRETVGRSDAGQPTGTIVNRVIGDPNPKWTGSLNVMKIKYRIFIMMMLALVSSCELDQVNPNAAAGEQVVTTREGIIALSIGLRQFYSTTGLSSIILAPSTTAREMKGFATFTTVLELEQLVRNYPLLMLLY